MAYYERSFAYQLLGDLEKAKEDVLAAIKYNNKVPEYKIRLKRINLNLKHETLMRETDSMLKMHSRKSKKIKKDYSNISQVKKENRNRNEESGLISILEELEKENK